MSERLLLIAVHAAQRHEANSESNEYKGCAALRGTHDVPGSKLSEMFLSFWTCEKCICDV
jgi:hypothetical protein